MPNTNLLRHLLHAFVSWRATIVEEERRLPVIVVGLKQVPGTVSSSHQPHILGLVTTARDNTSLQRNNTVRSKYETYHFECVTHKSNLLRLVSSQDEVSRGDNGSHGQTVERLVVTLSILKDVTSEKVDPHYALLHTQKPLKNSCAINKQVRNDLKYLDVFKQYLTQVSAINVKSLIHCKSKHALKIKTSCQSLEL